MKLTWNQTPDSDEMEITWTLGSLAVNAAQYDTGEWVIRYGESGQEPTELYSRNVFTREDAMREAKACMRDLTAQFVEDRKETA